MFCWWLAGPCPTDRKLDRAWSCSRSPGGGRFGGRGTIARSPGCVVSVVSSPFLLTRCPGGLVKAGCGATHPSRPLRKAQSQRLGTIVPLGPAESSAEMSIISGPVQGSQSSTWSPICSRQAYPRQAESGGGFPGRPWMFCSRCNYGGVPERNEFRLRKRRFVSRCRKARYDLRHLFGQVS